jgi:hypothetical protein
MHRASTFLPQLFHTHPFLRPLALLAGLLAVSTPLVRAQAIDQGAVFRVFLADGRSVASVGEHVVIGDRVVFTMAIGGSGAPSETPFMSLPVAAVDLERTAAYAKAVRRAYYAATRGEEDYQALSSEVARALDAIQTTADRKQRLQMAIDARQRLLTWSQDNYGYRASDVRELASQFDSVIASLRAQAGEPATLDLMSGDIGKHRDEVLLPAMGLRESIEAVLSASAAADTGVDRETVLRAALAVLDGSPLKTDETLRAELTRHLDAELLADRAYAALSASLISRADAALRTGNVKAAEALTGELAARERTLGSQRAGDIQALSDALAAKIEATRAYRLALDHYALIRPTLLQYERDVRPTLAGMDGLAPILQAIRDMAGGPSYHYLDLAEERLARMADDLPKISVPDDLVMRQVHATLVSAILMARQACARHRRVLVARNAQIEQEGSSAATAAQMLIARARADLITRLYPPPVRQP